MPSRFTHENARQVARSATMFKVRLSYILTPELMEQYSQEITDAHMAECKHLIATAARRLIRARKYKRQSRFLRGKLDHQYRVSKAQFAYIVAQREILKKNKLLVDGRKFFKEI